MIRKCLSVAIILLFIIISIIPSTGIDAEKHCLINDSIGYFNSIMESDEHGLNITLNGTMGENGWYVSDVTITITWDPEKIDAVYYKINYGKWALYIEPIVISEDDEYIFCWYYVYNDGIHSEVECIKFRIDQTPPTIKLTVEKIGSNTWLFIADVYDETSGIDRVEFYVGDEFVGEVTEAPFEWEYSGSGYTMQAVVYDNAGNSAESEVIYNRPVIKLEPPPFPSMIPILRVFITNIGDANATDVEWSFKWDGGWILFERFDAGVRETSGEIPVISPGAGTAISSIKFGLGRATITISAKCVEGSSDELVFEARMYGFFLIIPPKV